jgi:hypothetical protein
MTYDLIGGHPRIHRARGADIHPIPGPAAQDIL